MKGLGIWDAAVLPAGRRQRWELAAIHASGGPTGLASFVRHVCSPRLWPAREELGLGGRPDCGRRGPERSCLRTRGEGVVAAAQAKKSWARIDVCTPGPGVCESGPRVAGSPVPAKAPSRRALTV